MLRTHSLLITILLLFVLSAVFLTIRHESLLKEADQTFVSLSYLHPEDPKDQSFVISHRAENSRTLEVSYHYQNQEVQKNTIPLAPHEEKVFTPESAPLSITVRYQDSENQEQLLTLYKK